jgi:cytochrome c-type biogenesis protein CcmH/NrfG
VHHRKAEQLLRQALAANPGFIEARLRLGRVLAESRNYDEAVTHFQRVIDSASDRLLTYYAQLFTGDARMAMGHAADAKSAYEDAIGLYPDSQAAHLGLGAALRMLGQKQVALDAVMSTLALAPDSRDAEDEPWWNYYEGDAANVDRLFEELRRPFREPVK